MAPPRPHCSSGTYCTATVVRSRSLPRTLAVRSVSSKTTRSVRPGEGFAHSVALTNGISDLQDLVRRVRSDTVAERPVLLRHLDEIHPHVLAPHAQSGEIVGDAAEEGALLLQRAAAGDGDLRDDEIRASQDIHVARVVDEILRLVLGDQLESVERRYVDRFDERAVDGVADAPPLLGRPTLGERDAYQRHGPPSYGKGCSRTACRDPAPARGGRRARARAAVADCCGMRRW